MIFGKQSQFWLLVSVCAVFSLTNCNQDRKLPDPNLSQRKKALEEVEESLKKIKRASPNALIPFLKHKDCRIKRAAALRLGTMGKASTDAVPKLIEKLNDEHPRVRIAAARSLGKIKDKRSLKPLVEKLADKDRKVRRWVWKSLSRFEPDHLMPVLIQSLAARSPYRRVTFRDEGRNKVSIQDVIRERLPSLGRAIVPELAKELSNPDKRIRGSLVQTLGTIGKDANGAISELADVVENDEEKRIRIWAIESLENIGDLDPWVIPVLKKASMDENKSVARRAKQAVARLQSTEASKAPKRKKGAKK